MKVTPTDTHDRPRQQECPVCRVVIPVTPGYVIWCDRCGWNVEAGVEVQPRTLWESLCVSLGRRLSESLFEQVKHEDSPRSRLKPSNLLGLLLAGVVHSLTFLLAGVGIAVIVRG